jgi:hypothetical protein
MNLRVIALSNSKNDFLEDGIDLKGVAIGYRQRRIR